MHGVVNGEGCNHFATGTVDVKMDVFAAIFALQVKQLHHNIIGVAGMDIALQKDDSIFEQQVAERQLTLTLIALISMRIGQRMILVIGIQRTLPFGWMPS